MSKITLPRATVQQALEALELLDEYDNTRTMLTDDAIDEVLATADAAIAALRAALEEPTETVEVINVDSRKISVYDAGVQAMTDDDMIRLANAIRARGNK